MKILVLTTEPFVGTGADPRFTPREHQQALAIGPFGNIYEADAVSPEAAMRGLQDRDVYNQRKCQVDVTQEQHNIHISLINLDLFYTSTYKI